MTKRKNGSGLSVEEMVLFAYFGAMMFVFKTIEGLPNCHPLALLITVFTVVYRAKALWIIAVFDFLVGLLWAGFGIWWYPYLYLWTILWAVVMLLPKNMKKENAVVVYATVCTLHGLLYGTMYAPYQALVFHYNFKQTLAWIGTGLPYDIWHSVSNFAMSLLCVPLIDLLRKVDKRAKK